VKIGLSKGSWSSLRVFTTFLLCVCVVTTFGNRECGLRAFMVCFESLLPVSPNHWWIYLEMFLCCYSLLWLWCKCYVVKFLHFVKGFEWHICLSKLNFDTPYSWWVSWILTSIYIIYTSSTHLQNFSLFGVYSCY
jgi:hypothetical protein